MGTISILLGCITLIVSVFAGVEVGLYLRSKLSIIAGTLLTVGASVNHIAIGVAVIICFIGLLASVNLIMNGLIYNRLKKLRKEK